MKTKFPPDPIDVLQDLEALSAVVRPILVNACDFGVLHCEKHQQPMDPYLHSHMARRQVCLDLDQREPDLEAIGFVRVPLAFSGLHLVSAEYSVRLLKAGHDRDPVTNEIVRRMPVPNTRSRLMYYNQQPLMDTTALMSEIYQFQPVNLLYLWDVNQAYQLSSFDLACPKYAGRTRDSLRHYFYVNVPEVGQPIDQDHTFPSARLDDIQFPPQRLDETGTDDAASSG